jgi:hypothetical protein
MATGGAACSNGVCIAPRKIGEPCTVGKSECEIFAAVCVDGTCQAVDYGACK